MRLSGTSLILSAADLSNHLACAHLSWLNLQVVKGRLELPAFFDPGLKALQERGMHFEAAYLQYLKDQGLTIVKPSANEDSLTVDQTIQAMKNGADVIYQAALKMDLWQGRADFLLKVDKPGRLGNWSYEVADTKLAVDTRAGTVLQISLYSQMISAIQGVSPELMHVVKPVNGFEKESYRVDDFSAYTRLVQKRLLLALERDSEVATTYPEPVDHCSICRWWQHCSGRRRIDDHLSLVAGLSTAHTKELTERNISTVAKLSEESLPLAWKPSKGAAETYTRLREQARLQVAARKIETPPFELLELQEGAGLARLPEPSEGDIFFDFEGDPFVGTGGLEYLFGWTCYEQSIEVYHHLWAFDANQEKAVFEQFVDWVMERWEKYPDLHIYHYTSYEPSALKRLMGKHGTRENEIDRMLRAGIFVDLFTVTKQALRAGIESYSLKELEIIHGFTRKLALRDAALHKRAFEQLLEIGPTDELPEDMRHAIAQYNREDCESTRALRDWLEKLRSGLVVQGAEIPRPIFDNGDPGEELDAHQQKIKDLFERLTAGISQERSERSNEEQGRWLLANMLDWYRREKKATWWEMFRLRDLSDEEMLDEKAGIAGLTYTGKRETVKKSVIDLYRFPPQDTDIHPGDKLLSAGYGGPTGEVVSIDLTTNTIRIKKGPSIKDNHPLTVFVHDDIKDTIKADAILRIATWVAENGIDADGPYRAGRDLLLGHPPRTSRLVPKDIDSQHLAVHWVTALDQGVLPIQGPPGAGKSYTASQMILALVKEGKKVGVTALGHKVIQNLLKKASDTASAAGVALSCMQKVTTISDTTVTGIEEVTKPADILAALHNGEVQVVGGTAWLWARDDFFNAVDVLFVDEAGQLSLIDTLAVSQAAASLVLLGDPQQLKQPQQGSHPEGTEVSALEHALGGHKTILPEKGIFLDTTWRMHPSICSFVSELFYEGRLHAMDKLINQRVAGDTAFAGAGLWFVPVEHSGNQGVSMEEVNKVKAIIDGLVTNNVYWVDENRQQHVLTAEDIKVIAPYNAQVGKIKATVTAGIQVGTVDKFQGQEAPVIIFSMATSTPADAPRGMEFLYSLNRLNVAVSRARGVCILVASPKLFEPDCKSPAQMRLANAFCRYIELASL